MTLYLVTESHEKTNLFPYEIISFHVAPTLSALGTISHVLLDMRSKGIIPRVDTTYALLPFRQNRVMDMAWPDAKAMGIAPRVISDIPPQSDESEEIYRDRVISWFTNRFLPSYESGLANTAIVADAKTLDIIVTYLNARGSKSADNKSTDEPREGAIFTFTPNGFRFLSHGHEYSFK